MLRGVSGVPTPVQVPFPVLTFHDKLDHLPGEETVQLSLEEGEIEGDWLFRGVCLEENRLLIGAAPSVCPLVLNTLHLHPIEEN